MKTQPTQRDVTRLCIQCAQLLLQYGEESFVIKDLSSRMGLMLGVESVESTISLDAIVLTTITNGRCYTTTRKNIDRGVNMHVVTEIHHLVVLLEHKLLDFTDVKKKMDEILPMRYPRWLVAICIGFSCACFCKLNNGGWDGAIISLCAATVAMYTRQFMAHNLIHPLINFCATAFVATTISDLLLQQNYFYRTPSVAMAASLLLLVPGFPLINALSDMFKGNVNTGIDRWVMASLMTLATCIGVIFSLSIFGGGGWIPLDLSH